MIFLDAAEEILKAPHFRVSATLAIVRPRSWSLSNSMGVGFSGMKMPRSICCSWGLRLFQSAGGFLR